MKFIHILLGSLQLLSSKMLGIFEFLVKTFFPSIHLIMHSQRIQPKQVLPTAQCLLLYLMQKLLLRSVLHF
jgi:hypothetical protein